MTRQARQAARTKPPPLPDDPVLAASALLPLLDAGCARGDATSGQAAEVIRALVSRLATPPMGAPDETMARATARLVALVQAQERQIAGLHALLDATL